MTYVDQNLNFNLSQPEVVPNPALQPQLTSLKNCFIRGSTVRYIHLPQDEVDQEVLLEACKNEVKNQK